MTSTEPNTPPVVLVVEDEPLVRMTAADTLEDAGFRVLEAVNADAALAVLEACSEEVQVLFTDVNMTDTIGGMALAEQVHQRWPQIWLLVASGYPRPDPNEIPDHGQFGPKPCHGATLVRQIAERMQAPQGRKERRGVMEPRPVKGEVTNTSLTGALKRRNS